MPSYLPETAPDAPPLTLFCLPFAGGSRYSYAAFRRHASPNITLHPTELPGHGKRIGEPLLTDIHAMVDDLLAQVRGAASRPYALFGHSLGAILAYLLTRRLIDEALPLPLHLFCSGYRAPSLMPPPTQTHRLPHDAFIAMLKTMGGLPESVLDNQEDMAFFEPILRADLRALETYVYQPAAPLTIPITVWIGRADTITDEEAWAWQHQTTVPISVTPFEGGHFFLYKYLPELGRIMSRTLAQTLRAS